MSSSFCWIEPMPWRLRGQWWQHRIGLTGSCRRGPMARTTGTATTATPTT